MKLVQHQSSNNSGIFADSEIPELARKASNGAKFIALFDRGDWQGQSYPSQSEADLALCSMFAFWTGGDVARIDALFRSSGLMREKWNRNDYRTRSINEAVSVCGEAYTPENADVGGDEPDHDDVHVTAEDDPQPPARYSDIALGNRLVQRHGDDMRFIAGEWWVYNAEESRWTRDELLRVFTWARRICTEASKEAFTAVLKSKGGTPAQATAVARAIASAAKVAATISMARAHKKIPAMLDIFDRDSWLLNTPGGVVDLKTGTMRPSRREDYFTKRTPVALAKMPSPVFDRFLREIMGEHIQPEVCQCAACAQSKGKSSDERLTLHQQEVGELCAYLKRLYGYCLSADVRTHLLVIQVGEGGNGKGALNDFISQDILGLSPVGYATEIPIEALLIPKGERHPTELMDLFHARLALARETGEDVRWNEGRVKRLSGGDLIKARRMRQDFVEFKPP